MGKEFSNLSNNQRIFNETPMDLIPKTQKIELFFEKLSSVELGKHCKIVASAIIFQGNPTELNILSFHLHWPQRMHVILYNILTITPYDNKHIHRSNAILSFSIQFSPLYSICVNITPGSLMTTNSLDTLRHNNSRLCGIRRITFRQIAIRNMQGK